MLPSAVHTPTTGIQSGWMRIALRRIGLSLVVSSLVAAAVLRAQAPRTAPATRVAAAALDKAGDAVVTVVAYRDGSSDVISGTGVRVADGRVVTALRNLRGASRAEIIGADGELLATVTTMEQAEATLDLAVLQRFTAPGARLGLALRSPTVAQRVKVLGPRKGTVRSVVDRSLTRIEPDDGRHLLRLGAPVTPTAAGSPVVNVRSQLVGIALGTVPGRLEGDIVVDVSAVRELLMRPSARLALPSRDGTIAIARPAAEPKPSSVAVPANRADDPASKPRAAIFPERYGAPIGTDTARAWALELYGCARLESQQKVYCYLRITNLSRGATFALNGSDLADSTRQKVRTADNLILGETTMRVAGWRTKALVPLRELESARVALEFAPPDKDADAVRLMLDVAGERPLWFGPFILQRVP